MRKLNPVVQLICFLLCSLFVSSLYAQDAAPSKELALYNQIKAFDLNGGAIDVKGLVLKKDRTQITLDGVVDWVMVLPLKLEFGDNQRATTTVIVQGVETPFQIRLPMRPRKVELDPDHWILSERTSTKGN